MKREIPSTIAGVTKYIAKRICEYAFGDYFLVMKVDYKNMVYNIFVIDKLNSGEEISSETIADFERFWGNQWKVKIIEEKHKELYTE